MSNTSQMRNELGDFSSIVCFKAVVVGTEEALGKKLLRSLLYLLVVTVVSK